MKLLARQVALLLVMVAVGTAIDWAVHSSREVWYVEPAYFRNKIIFGVVWGVIGYYALRRILGVSTVRGMAFGVPAVIAGVLQTKYFYQGRPMDFVVTFLFLHYLMFLPVAFLIFSRYRAILPPASVPRAGTAGRRWAMFIGAVVAVEAVFYLYFRFFPPLY